LHHAYISEKHVNGAVYGENGDYKATEKSWYSLT
jgi:hypothetical protein